MAFEQYSTQCENDTRKDAALHSYLHVMTAKARWIMEVALEKLAEVEQIDIKELTHPLRLASGTCSTMVVCPAVCKPVRPAYRRTYGRTGSVCGTPVG